MFNVNYSRRPYWNIHSPPATITVNPYSDARLLSLLQEAERNNAPIRETVTKGIWFNGVVNFAVGLDRQVFTTNEGFILNVEIDSKNVTNAVNSIWSALAG